jgi:hypothetical protein
MLIVDTQTGQHQTVVNRNFGCGTRWPTDPLETSNRNRLPFRRRIASSSEPLFRWPELLPLLLAKHAPPRQTAIDVAQALDCHERRFRMARSYAGIADRSHPTACATRQHQVLG